MALRIQRERIGNLDGIPGIDEYFANYGISHESMKVAKPDAIVMHPGPMNRGIEIEGSIADGPTLCDYATGNERRRRAHGCARSRRQNDGVPVTTAAQQQAQKNRDTIFVEDGEVISVEAFPGEQFVMRIRAPKCAAAAEPGSFAHVTLRRIAADATTAVHHAGRGSDWIEILYKTVATACSCCRAKLPATSVSVLGPIGQPFRMYPTSGPTRC